MVTAGATATARYGEGRETRGDEEGAPALKGRNERTIKIGDRKHGG